MNAPWPDSAPSHVEASVICQRYRFGRKRAFVGRTAPTNMSPPKNPQMTVPSTGVAWVNARRTTTNRRTAPAPPNPIGVSLRRLELVDPVGALSETSRNAKAAISRAPATADAAVTMSTCRRMEEIPTSEPGPPMAATTNPRPIAASASRTQVATAVGAPVCPVGDSSTLLGIRRTFC
jgi:hypothetical protein